MQVVNLGFRLLQLIFAAIVLALSVTLAKGQLIGDVPALTGYAAFCGGLGLVVAGLGILAALWESFPGVVMAAIDALCTLLTMAGAIALAVKLGVHSCAPNPGELDFDHVPKTANRFSYYNPITSTGANADQVDYAGRCREAQADTAFLFFAFACFAVSTALDFLSRSSGSGGGFKFPGRKGGSSYV